MTDTDLWDRVKSVRKKAGISDTNFRKMKSNGALAEKWVTPVYLALKNTNKRVSLERVFALSQ